MNKTFKELKERNVINGLDELANVKGTRTDIYNAIVKFNSMAIIDCRNAEVKINDKRFLVFLKRVEKGVYKIDGLVLQNTDADGNCVNWELFVNR